MIFVLEKVIKHIDIKSSLFFFSFFLLLKVCFFTAVFRKIKFSVWKPPLPLIAKSGVCFFFASSLALQ